MLSLTHNLETTITSNESEALLLEANLIKKHKPRYNILLRDDKSFPYIYIGEKDTWPQLTKLRGKKSREGYYFGPFASIGSANWTIKILQKIFLLRVCDDTVFRNRDRACILYQIRRCSAPCVDKIKQNDYNNLVKDAVDFISGKSKRIQKNLSEEMEQASKDQDYEINGTAATFSQDNDTTQEVTLATNLGFDKKITDDHFFKFNLDSTISTQELTSFTGNFAY